MGKDVVERRKKGEEFEWMKRNKKLLNQVIEQEEGNPRKGIAGSKNSFPLVAIVVSFRSLTISHFL